MSSYRFLVVVVSSQQVLARAALRNTGLQAAATLHVYSEGTNLLSSHQRKLTSEEFVADEGTVRRYYAQDLGRRLPDQSSP